MRISRLGSPALAVLALTLLVSITAGQEKPGAVKGTVSDPIYGPISGVTITLTNATGDFKKTTVSGDDGSYSIPGVPPGAYNMRAESRTGVDAAKITVKSGEDAFLPFSMSYTGNRISTGAKGVDAVVAAVDKKEVTVAETRLDTKVLTYDTLGENPNPRINFGKPGAPSTDTYYDEGNIFDQPPDEFISNPDPSIKLSDLRGYHYPPVLQWIKCITPAVKPGSKVKFEAKATDKVRISPWRVSFQGPRGRRSTLEAQFRQRQDDPTMHDGELTISKWAEPGLYIPYIMLISNELGHSKAYFQDYHIGVAGARFLVVENPNIDVVAPELLDLRIGDASASPDELPAFDIRHPIPLFVKARDNASGVASIRIRIVGPSGKYSEVVTQPYYSEEDQYVALFNLPPNREGGEYFVQSMWIEDKAGQTLYTFPSTNPLLKKARFTVKQDPATVDTVPPRLASIFFDSKVAKLEQEIKVTVILADDLSGVGTVAVNVSPYPSFADHKRMHLKKVESSAIIQKGGFNYDSNVWTATFKTDKLDEPGEWVVTRVVARDKADNLLDVPMKQSPLLEKVRVFIEGSNVVTPKTETTVSQQTTTPPAGGKIRRVDMVPPHPPRGACLNCHEP